MENNQGTKKTLKGGKSTKGSATAAAAGAVKPGESTSKTSCLDSKSVSPSFSKKHESALAKDIGTMSISSVVTEGWGEFCLHSQLLLGLSKLNYVSPTPIQRQVLNVALKPGKSGASNRDILGCAETVKTYLKLFSRKRIFYHTLTL